MASSTDPRPVVLVVDDHELTRTLLTEALSQRLAPLAIASLPSSRVSADALAEIALAIMRVEPAQAAGLAARLAPAALPPGSERPGVSLRLLLLCEEDDAQVARAALAAGFHGVVSSDASLDLLVAAARLLLAGGAYFPQLVSAATPCGIRTDGEDDPIRMTLSDGCTAGRGSLAVGVAGRAPLADGFGDQVGASRHGAVDVPLDVGVFGEVAGLTARERLVLAEMCRGHPNKVIARVLNISENTAKMHVRRILAKLRVRNRTEAAVLINSRQQ